MFKAAGGWHFVLTVMVAWTLTPPSASAQDVSPFLFTVSTSDPTLVGGESRAAGGAVAEPGLARWTDGTFDPGVSAGLRVSSNLIVRSTKGTVDFVSDGQRFASFQQVEVLREIGHNPDRELAVGGGVREEWGSSRVFVGRVVAGLSVGGGRFESNAVFERATAVGRDAVDVITTVGWSRPVTNRIGLGIEGIGQDLEGFWSRDEADGGARLLIGPSVHVTAADRRWSLTIAGGPLLTSVSVVPASDALREMPSASSTNGHYAVLGSFTYTLSR